MEVFDQPPYNRNDWPGFTLLEVMLAGGVLMIFIVLGSQIIQQGLQEMLTRQESLQILRHIDEWTFTIKQAGFSSESLAAGAHQRDFVSAQGDLYPVYWEVQEVTPFMKSITFQLYHPHTNTLLHEWKSGLLWEN